MFRTWSKFNFNEPNNIQEATTQSLWRNTLIRIDGKTVYYKDWKAAGIVYFAHLIDNNGNLASVTFLNFFFGITPKYLSYKSLMHSIPAAWKKMLKNIDHSLGYTPPQVLLYKN
jgi:hypothetical protein